jgi:predicted DNA-binding transcriptional regulator AlpA
MANRNKPIKRRNHAPKIQNTDNLADEAIIRLPTVCNVTGLGASTVWAHVNRGLLPPPVPLEGNRTGWVWGTIRRYLAAKVEG